MTQILIVEDEVRLAAFIEKGLRKNGFTTIVAVDGEQAILMAESSDFDLLLLDLGLPVIDGFTVLCELRSRGEKRPIIIVTANNDERDKAAALTAGANDYITKPFSFKDLLTRVRVHLPTINH
ncbi:response regulator [Fischerella thermalis CCMEE 5198]|jgi:DNA-binding response OmpR family regulator|uniref:response regulator transcription factor n=1 Tax=Fischerella thermalis TaxID=372787 RepID=UPI000C800BF6|nr:response regulator [Fischerella thermalis]PMB04684.1 response regulator [Fischerella thermalis CCMEE 5196]PMB23154.1 response regulator [Fischerella thermalis CCMEE 5198]PMB50464.1 response regulator [Fischerella thermalis CCMEE 5201]